LNYSRIGEALQNSGYGDFQIRRAARSTSSSMAGTR
jgi:hypothetical protein